MDGLNKKQIVAFIRWYNSLSRFKELDLSPKTVDLYLSEPEAEYYTLNELAEFLGIGRTSLWAFLKKTKTKGRKAETKTRYKVYFSNKDFKKILDNLQADRNI